MFLRVSVILVTGGWFPRMHCRRYPSMPCRPPGPHPGGKLRGLAWGGLQVHTWGRGLQAHTQGGLQAHTWEGDIPACTEADPPSRRLLLWAVHTLLECILVERKCLPRHPFNGSKVNAIATRQYSNCPLAYVFCWPLLVGSGGGGLGVRPKVNKVEQI